MKKNVKLANNGQKCGQNAFLGQGRCLKGFKLIFNEKCKFGRKSPKIWPKCIFRPGKGLKGVKNHFLKKNLNLAKNGRKYGQNAFLGLGRG